MTAINYTTIENKIREWLVTASGLAGSNVIFANQNAPKPEGAYITVNPFLSVQNKGMTDEQVLLDDGKIKIYQVREFISSVNYFGDNALQKIQDCQNDLFKPSVYQDILNKAGIFTQDYGQVRNLTALTDDRYKQRAQIDIRFQVAGDIIDDVGYFDTFEMSGEIESQQNSGSGDFITVNSETEKA